MRRRPASISERIECRQMGVPCSAIVALAIIYFMIVSPGFGRMPG